MAGFYAALRRQNDAAPLADFATALHSAKKVEVATAQDMTNGSGNLILSGGGLIDNPARIARTLSLIRRR